MPMSTYRKHNLSQPPEQFNNCPEFLDIYLKYLSDFSMR